MEALQAGFFAGEYGGADITNDNGRLIRTPQIISPPEAGFRPATRELTLTAWRADTGRAGLEFVDYRRADQAGRVGRIPLLHRVWRGAIQRHTATRDGEWGSLYLFRARATKPETGEVFEHDDVIGTVGN